MRDLQFIIHNCFEDTYHTRCYAPPYPDYPNGKLANLIVPIEDSFEMPVFALRALKPDVNYIVADLQDIGNRTEYKSLDTGVRDILTTDFVNNRLVELNTKVGEPKYYGTYGAIFDKDFNLTMAILWKMQRYIVEDNEKYPYKFRYKFVEPILRVNPQVFINRSNSVERYIINKILSSAVLNYSIDRPRLSKIYVDDSNPYSIFRLKVEIGTFPSFYIKKPDVPSISTTNEELLKAAFDNIEDIIE